MTANNICFDEKFLEKSNPHLIKVRNDADRNRLASIFNKIIARVSNQLRKSLRE